MVSAEISGRRAAQIALKISRGDLIEERELSPENQSAYIIDWNAMQRFNVKKKDFPFEVHIRNYQIPFHVEHKLKIAAALGFILLQSVLIGFLMYYQKQRTHALKALEEERINLENTVGERTAELSEANKDLRDSENRFRSLSDAAFEGIIVSDKGRILDANNAAIIMFGYSTTELIGMKAINLVRPENREEVQNKILSGYEKLYEIIGLKKMGFNSRWKLMVRCIHLKQDRFE